MLLCLVSAGAFAQATLTFVAVDDAASVDHTYGLAVEDVRDNDTSFALPLADSDFTLQFVSKSTPDLQFVPRTGQVTVTNNATAGEATLVYALCENSTGLCDQATVRVTIPEHPPIVAGNDSYNIVNAVRVFNVLNNDTVNGVPLKASEVSLEISSPVGMGDLQFDTATGNVTVPANGRGGFRYRVISRYNSNVYTQAQVQVGSLPNPIDAVNDSGSIANPGGTVVANVLANDTLNALTATTGTVTLTQVSSSIPQLTLNTTSGAVNMAAGAAAGSHNLVYRICETANPANCDQAVVAVTVSAPAATIDAVNDSGSANAGGGIAVANVLANDTLGSAAATTATVTLTLPPVR
jgi:hypothetical protein